MSAWIVEDYVTNTIADYLGEDEASKASLANELYECNVKSVNYRYNNDTETKYDRYTKPEKVSEMQLLKWLRCWEYQSCESNECMQSSIYGLVCAAIQEIEERFKQSHNGINPCDTRQYDECQWG